MVEASFLIAVGLVMANLLVVVVLGTRRRWLAREEALRGEHDARMRPLALRLIDGETPDLRGLGQRDARSLAAILTRYGRQLSGTARDRITFFFESYGHAERERRKLRSLRMWRRAAAAYALGDMGATSATPDLIASLSDSSADVRASAARSLGRLHAAEAVVPLARSLATGSVPRAVASRALLAIGPAAAPELRRLLDSEEDQERASAAELLGLLGDVSSAAGVARLLSDPSPNVRARAALAVGRLGSTRSAGPLRAALDDPVASVRIAAARSLGAVQDREAARALLAIAQRDEPDAARVAAQSLARLAPDLLRAAARRPDASPSLLEAADQLEMGVVQAA
jgi:HEAT repeat protein